LNSVEVTGSDNVKTLDSPSKVLILVIANPTSLKNSAIYLIPFVNFGKTVFTVLITGFEILPKEPSNELTEGVKVDVPLGNKVDTLFGNNEVADGIALFGDAPIVDITFVVDPGNCLDKLLVKFCVPGIVAKLDGTPGILGTLSRDGAPGRDVKLDEIPVDGNPGTPDKDGGLGKLDKPGGVNLETLSSGPARGAGIPGNDGIVLTPAIELRPPSPPSAPNPPDNPPDIHPKQPPLFIPLNPFDNKLGNDKSIGNAAIPGVGLVLLANDDKFELSIVAGEELTPATGLENILVGLDKSLNLETLSPTGPVKLNCLFKLLTSDELNDLSPSCPIVLSTLAKLPTFVGKILPNDVGIIPDIPLPFTTDGILGNALEPNVFRSEPPLFNN